jgi:hypothetical protein
MRPELAELGGVRLVVEGAGDQHVETGVAALARGFDQIAALHGAELGADEDGGALLAQFTFRLPCSVLRRRPAPSPGHGVSAVKVIGLPCAPAARRRS